MIGIKLEMLSLMTTMRAAGLMPDDDYQQEKDRLVADILAIGSETMTLNLEAWRDPEYLDITRVPPDVPLKPNAKTFDWRSVISNLLESAHKGGWNFQEEIEAEAEVLGVQAAHLNQLSAGAHNLHKLFHMGVKFDYLIGESRKEIRELRAEVQHLKKTASERSEYAPAYNEVETVQPRRNADLQQIDELQTQMARLLSYAAQYEAKGNTFAAGQHRAEAAKLESKLRALGA
jgi:hypothetical protein